MAFVDFFFVCLEFSLCEIKLNQGMDTTKAVTPSLMWT